MNIFGSSIHDFMSRSSQLVEQPKFATGSSREPCPETTEILETTHKDRSIYGLILSILVGYSLAQKLGVLISVVAPDRAISEWVNSLKKSRPRDQ
jgi:hypothetical protein